MNTYTTEDTLGPYESAPVLKGIIKDSFAYITLRDRLPTILGKIVDSISRKLHDYHISNDPLGQDTVFIAEAKLIISEIGALRYNLVRDKQFPDFGDRVFFGVNWENAITELIHERKERSWFKAPWLVSECLMYRMIQEIVSRTTKWTSYDVFSPQKQESFTKFLDPVNRLACFIESNYNKGSLSLDDEVLSEMIQISLWGNQMDLSLFVNLLEKNETSSLQGSKEHILVDDTNRVIPAIRNISGGTVVFVLDNAGFELFSDLCLADYLTRTTSCKIHFEMKAYPWFVSDTISNDFEFVINQAQKLGQDHDHVELQKCSRRWRDWVTNGRWQIGNHSFWTSPYSFWNMNAVAPDLVQMLRNASFIFFKGDLNYRKMVNDASWDPLTPFSVAIGPVVTFSLAPFVMLRTCKSDTISGLSSETLQKRVQSNEQDWMVSGKYGMIQCCL